MVGDDTATGSTVANATAATDYIISGDTETIAANATEDTISVPIRGDDETELNETFTITLTNPVGASLLNPSVKGTIINDDEAVLTIADATLLEGANSATGKMQFTVSTFPLSNTEITATWTTSSEPNDTATADVDYTTATGTVQIPPNTRSGTFEVDIKGDDTPELNETFTVTISSPSANAHIFDSANSASGTIRNDDGIGLSIANADILEGADNTTSQLQFTVTATPPPEAEITAEWATSNELNDLATADEDYTTATGTVRIPPNTRSGTFEVDIKGDDTPEFNETFTVTLSNPSAGSEILANKGSATGKITNDDGTGLRIEANSIEEGTQGATSNLTFTITTVPPFGCSNHLYLGNFYSGKR